MAFRCTKPLKRFGVPSSIRCLVSCGYLFMGDTKGIIKQWDAPGHEINNLRGHSNWIFTLCEWDEWICSGSMDNTIRLWNKITGECIKVLSNNAEAQGI